jgi:hypothetical protein
MWQARERRDTQIRSLVGRCEVKGLLGRPRLKWKDELLLNFKLHITISE